MRATLAFLLVCTTASAEQHPDHLTEDNLKSLACDECQAIAYTVGQL